MKSFNKYYNLREEAAPVPDQQEPETVSIPLGKSIYELEVADTPDKIYQGLSGRNRIPAKTGMLFIMPEEETQSFCMRDCLCNIDLIYLNSKGKIVDLHKMTKERSKTSFETDIQYNRRLKSYESKDPAKYVIEIPAGDITRLNLKIGQKMNLNKYI